MLRRLRWRAGRWLYAGARGEAANSSIESNGEAQLQAQVLAALPLDEKLQIFDVGGFRADWTISLLRQASAERLQPERLAINMFEPFADAADRCEQNLATVPGHDLCRVNRIALSDKQGSTKMAIHFAEGGTNSLIHDTTAGEPGDGWRDVPLDTIDNFCASNGIDHVHLLKIDAEGHDYTAICGARSYLAAGKIDILQFEYNHRWIYNRSFLKDVFDLIAGTDARLIRINGPAKMDVFA